MPKIKWIGIINGDAARFQKGELGSGAVKLDMPATMADMMVRALPFAIPPFLVIFLSMFLKTFLSHQRVVSPMYILAGVIAGFVGLGLHELLHAAVYPREAAVYIGWDLRAFAAVALVSYPLKRGRFIWMSLLPVVLGAAPMAVFCASPGAWTAWNGFWFGFAVMGLMSPYPDFYNVYQVLRQTPKGCWVQIYGEDMVWFPA